MVLNYELDIKEAHDRVVKLSKLVVDYTNLTNAYNDIKVKVANLEKASYEARDLVRTISLKFKGGGFVTDAGGLATSELFNSSENLNDAFLFLSKSKIHCYSRAEECQGNLEYYKEQLNSAKNDLKRYEELQIPYNEKWGKTNEDYY